MVTVKVGYEATGPLSDGSAQRWLKDATRAAVQELATAGHGRLLQTLRPRPAGVYLSVQEARPGSASTGNYRRNISTTITGLNAVITDGGVVYGSWLEGVSSRNTTTRFKGYASFRRVGQWVEKQQMRVLRAHIGRFVRRASGK
jgi:hypothetical protein